MTRRREPWIVFTLLFLVGPTAVIGYYAITAGSSWIYPALIIIQWALVLVCGNGRWPWQQWWPELDESVASSPSERPSEFAPDPALLSEDKVVDKTPLPDRHPDMITRRMSNGDCRVEKYDPSGKVLELWLNGEKQSIKK